MPAMQIDMGKVLTHGQLPELKAIKPANRKERRNAVNKKKSGCACCHRRILDPAEMVWYGSASAHRLCAEARNTALAQAKEEFDAQEREETLERVRASGLIIPEGALLTPGGR